MKKTQTYLTVTAWLCTGLLLVLLVLQFLPNWSANGDTTSVNGYVWRITVHTGLQDWFASQIAGYDITQTIVMPILQLVFAFFGIVVFLIKRNEWFVSVFGIACGLTGLWGCITRPEFQLGSLWGAFLGVNVLLTLAGLAALVLNIYRSRVKRLKKAA